MNDTIIEFNFGSALGTSNVSFEKLNKTYNTICIRALDSLKDRILILVVMVGFHFPKAI